MAKRCKRAGSTKKQLALPSHLAFLEERSKVGGKFISYPQLCPSGKREIERESRRKTKRMLALQLADKIRRCSSSANWKDYRSILNGFTIQYLE